MSIDVLKLLLAAINICITPVLSGAIYSLVESIKKRKLKIFVESQGLFDKLDDNFKNSFINPTIKEILFYLHTGILTNEKSIPRFIELKNRLGGNYTWKQIRLVKWHVNTKDGPLLSLNITQKYTLKLTLYFLFIVIVISSFEFVALILIMDNLSTNEYLSLLMYIILPLATVLLLAYQVTSISKVKTMMKILEEQEQSQLQEITENNQ